ncbi:MAG: hypothetical protein ACFFBP_14685 [Promethearchaeota archaeon]
MADLLKDSSKSNNGLEELCYVYVLYFDEAKGHQPLLIFPTEKYKDNKKFMRPIKFHPIWFFDIKGQDSLAHVDVEYKGYTFFGKKIQTISKRKKKRAGLEEETPETIVIIVSLPNDLVIFGDELIRIMTDNLKSKFEEKLYEIIEYFDVKDEIIKSPKIKEKIENGLKFKKELNDFICDHVKSYFNDAIKQYDHLSIKKQKAISFLTLKGYDISHIEPINGKSEFSNIKLFDATKKSDELSIKSAFSILSINNIEDSNEIEILLRSNSKDERTDIITRINHVEEFFEKEILNQEVDYWFPEEEILFVFPILPQIKEYLLFVIDKKTNEKLLTRKIDITKLNKIKS